MGRERGAHHIFFYPFLVLGLLMVSVTGIARTGGNGRPMEEAGFETVPIFCTSALPKERSHITSSSSHDRFVNASWL